MGSLVAALASYLDARSHRGRWLLRMEDLDPPRESREAADQILFALDALDLHWDGPVLYQSTRHAAYEAAIQALQAQDKLFACDCSRQQLQEFTGIYPGTCRERGLAAGAGTAIRLRITDADICYEDRLQGRQCQNLEKDVGDFIIHRKDGLFAYQLAVVVDDAHQHVTHVVRGIDLMDSTPRQLYLMQLLGKTAPRYAHIPVIVDTQGQKLSKQQMAAPIDPAGKGALLTKALVYLQQEPLPELALAPANEVLAWAVDHWSPQPLTGQTSLPEVTV